MERHQIVALMLFVVVVLYTSIERGFDNALGGNIVLAILLIPILAYRLIAYFSGFGFPEYFAKDFGSENHPGPYAVFFWIFFIIACSVVLFEWSLY